jgi:serine/threonine-protein kinase
VTCPDSVKLDLLLSDKLAEKDFEEIEAHVENCPRCQANLQRLVLSTASTATGPSVGSRARLARVLAGGARSAAPANTPLATADELADALQKYQVLAPARLNEITASLKGRSADARGLARELVQRGWLTPFQANQLILGRGADLVLGPYLLVERLGEGGMGQVFKAYHPLMERTVALKVIRKERLGDEDAVQRFHREIRMAAQLNDPHIVQAYEAGRAGDNHFLVMEYAEGTDLQRLVRESGPLPVGQACSFISQAAQGLQHAHERGMVHRDVKPSNLQMTGGGKVVKLLDLGLARSQVSEGHSSGVTELTRARTVLGTPDYIAPEQIDDPRRVDIRADIYSLGCTLYFLLTGRSPFPRGSWEEKLLCHRREEPQPIEQLRPDVPAGLAAVLRKMLAKKPEDRYATPAAVAAALVPFRQPLLDLARSSSDCPPARTSIVVPGPVVPQPGADRRKRFWLVAGIAVLGAVLLLVLFWSRGDRPDPKSDEGPAKISDGEKDKSKERGGAPDGGKEPTVAEVLCHEDFSKLLKSGRALPDGWKCDSNAIVADVDQGKRPCLRVVAREADEHFLTLPPLKLGGDFGIEVGTVPWSTRALGGAARWPKMTVHLEASRGGAPLTITVDIRGVAIGNGLPRGGMLLQGQPFYRYRIVRQGKVIRTFIDNEIAATTTVDELPEYDVLRIGLVSPVNLYSLKVGPVNSSP